MEIFFNYSGDYALLEASNVADALVLRSNASVAMLEAKPFVAPLNLSAFTRETRDDADVFLRCWRLPNCDACLGSQHPCSWCALSQTCVPNAHSFPILAPIRHDDI